jgi:hypothetical protein
MKNRNVVILIVIIAILLLLFTLTPVKQTPIGINMGFPLVHSYIPVSCPPPASCAGPYFNIFYLLIDVLLAILIPATIFYKKNWI